MATEAKKQKLSTEAMVPFSTFQNAGLSRSPVLALLLPLRSSLMSLSIAGRFVPLPLPSPLFVFFLSQSLRSRAPLA